MSQQHLARLWTVVGTVLAFYVLNTWLLSQGGVAIFDAKLLDGRSIIAAYWGTLIGGLLLFLLAFIGRVYADRSGADTWHERLPVVGLEGLDTGSREGKWYQAFFLVFFVLVPAASLIHFQKKIYEYGRVVEKREIEPGQKPTRVPLSYVPPAGEFLSVLDDRYCLGKDIDGFSPVVTKANPCKQTKDWEGGTTWLPVVSPLLSWGLTVAAWWSALLLLLKLKGRP